MRNSGEEKKVIEPLVLYWLKCNDFDMSVVDTAAVWNPIAQRYLRRQASESLPDLIGNRFGLSVWIELKSQGKRHTINKKNKKHQREQRDFIIRKIRQGCFACVTDGVPHLRALWFKYINAATELEKKQILMEDLPRLTESRQRTFSDLLR